MRVQIRSLEQDNRNTQNGNSMMKVAEGAVSSTVEILKTLKEKVINAANDSNTDADRQTIQKELDQSIDQIDDNANVTFNGKYLVDGSHNWENKSATSSAITNQSLQTGTKSTSKLTELKDRNGNSLQIQSTDFVTVSYVKEGKTYTSTSKIESMTLQQAIQLPSGLSTAAAWNDGSKIIGTDRAGNTVMTANEEDALTLQAQKTGVDNQISGFTISISDRDGNIKKSANAILDNFDETLHAENKSTDNAFVFQIGTRANQAVKVGISDMRSQALGLKGSDGTTLNIGTQKNANAAINVLDNAISKALDQQTTLGAVQSRLEYTSSNLTTAQENVTASESTIRDADMAKEMTEYTKNNVLLQAAQSMLAQANQNSSAVLSLLQ
jgi:flagellin